MKILVLNCGSSSIKYQFIDTEKEIVLAIGLVERIGMGSAVLSHTPYGKEKIRIVGEILDHSIAIEYVIAVLLSPNHGVIKNKSEIDAIGHRVVHGGETFSGSVLITDEVMKALKDNIELAPRQKCICQIHLNAESSIPHSINLWNRKHICTGCLMNFTEDIKLEDTAFMEPLIDTYRNARRI
jgi:acetate kinase